MRNLPEKRFHDEFSRISNDPRAEGGEHADRGSEDRDRRTA